MLDIPGLETIFVGMNEVMVLRIFKNEDSDEINFEFKISAYNVESYPGHPGFIDFKLEAFIKIKDYFGY